MYIYSLTMSISDIGPMLLIFKLTSTTNGCSTMLNTQFVQNVFVSIKHTVKSTKAKELQKINKHKWSILQPDAIFLQPTGYSREKLGYSRSKKKYYNFTQFDVIKCSLYYSLCYAIVYALLFISTCMTIVPCILTVHIYFCDYCINCIYWLCIFPTLSVMLVAFLKLFCN